MANAGISLQSIEIDGLFGKPSFTITLDPKRPTILTGANGTGKSTILRLISALSNGDYVTLASAPLKQLKLNIEGIEPLVMTDNGRGFELKWGQRRGQLATANFMDKLPEWAVQLMHESHFVVDEALEHMSESAAKADAPFAEYIETRELLTNHRSGTPVISAPNWMADFGAAFSVLFVSDQRLVTERPERRRKTGIPSIRSSGLAVETAAREVSNEIEKAYSEYGRTSQQLDRRFPEEMLRALTNHRGVSSLQLDRLSLEVEEKRNALRAVGLLERDAYGPDLPDSTFDDDTLRTVMNTILESTLSKFAVLNDLERRLSSFKAFLDKRFAPKVLQLSRGAGIRFDSENAQEVRPRQLSSGEQQMMVLAYEILFKARPNTLVIVDEPELSLHVLWQDTLVEDLTNMGDIAGLQFLMATHSPTILAEHPELERALRP